MPKKKADTAHEGRVNIAKLDFPVLMIENRLLVVVLPAVEEWPADLDVIACGRGTTATP